MPILTGLDKPRVLKYLKSELADRKIYLRPLRDEFTKYLQVLNFEIYESDAKDSLSQFLPNDGVNIVNMMAAYLSGEKVEIDAHPMFPEYGQYPNASEMERCLWAVLMRNAEREGVPSVHNMALWNSLAMGVGATYCYWDEEIAEQAMVFPEDMEGNPVLDEEGLPLAIMRDSPIVLRSIWPYNLYWREGGPMGRYLYIMRVERQSIADVQEQFDVELPEARGKQLEDLYKADDRKHGIEVTDYWGWEKVDGDWSVVNAVQAGKTLVKAPEVAEGYEDLPYTIFSAYRTDQPQPEKRFLSALHPVRHAIYQLAVLQSAMIKNVHRSLDLPIFYMEGARGGRRDIKIDSGLFNLIRGKTGDQVTVPQIPGFESSATFEQGWIKEQITEGSFSIPLLTEQVPSGLAATRVVEQGIVRLAQPRKELQMAYQQDLMKIRNYVVNFAADIPIRLLAEYRGVSGVVDMRGSDLEPLTFTVKLGGELPLDDWRKANLGMSMAGLGNKAPLSQKMQLQRFWGVDQPEDVLEEKIYEMALGHPAVQAAALSDALSDLGVNISPQEIMGMSGGGGRGPAPSAIPGQPAGQLSPQEAQGQEFAMLPANANQALQGPGPRGPAGPLDVLGGIGGLT